MSDIGQNYWCQNCMAYHVPGLHLGATQTSTSNVQITWANTPLIPKYKTFDDAVRALSTEIAEMVIKKQRDYGPKNILRSPYGPMGGLRVRLWDKYARLENLLDNDKEPNNESLDDTFKDIVGYALVALMVRNETFELPLAEEK